MPARVVVVHDDPRKTEALVTRLGSEGYEVTGFPDALAAYDALLEAGSVELLITRIQFDDGRSNGISLAMLGRTKKPNMKVLFVARPVYEGLTQGIGEFLPWTASIERIVAEALSMLRGQTS
jgi:DNA-binding response OmpR family regulator